MLKFHIIAAAIFLLAGEARAEDEREAMIRKAAAAEESSRAAATIARVQGEWGALIANRVRKFWAMPIGAPERFMCKVDVGLTPDGAVLSAAVVQDCGGAAMNTSLETAVFKASPLPLPSLPAAFNPRIYLVFCPNAGCQ